MRGVPQYVTDLNLVANKNAEILRWESLALRATPLPQDDRRVGRGANRAGWRLESDWLCGSLRDLNLLFRLPRAYALG